MQWEFSSGKGRPFCLGFNVINDNGVNVNDKYQAKALYVYNPWYLAYHMVLLLYTSNISASLSFKILESTLAAPYHEILAQRLAQMEKTIGSVGNESPSIEMMNGLTNIEMLHYNQPYFDICVFTRST